jgi:hypothetical protein
MSLLEIAGPIILGSILGAMLMHAMRASYTNRYRSRSK